MGLIVPNVELTNGLIVTESYTRIDSISGNKMMVTTYVNYYKDRESYLTGKTHLVQKQINFTPSVDDDAPNFIKQGYEYLKTLPEFANAVDA